jgi:hypothetical protein
VALMPFAFTALSRRHRRAPGGDEVVRRAEESEEGGKGGAAGRRRGAKPEIDAEVRKSLRAVVWVFLPHDVITAVAHGRQPVVYSTYTSRHAVDAFATTRRTPRPRAAASTSRDSASSGGLFGFIK